MSMTRKDYEAVAQVLRDVAMQAKHERDIPADDPSNDLQTWQLDAFGAVATVTRRLAQHFAQDNPRFDADRFVNASGV